MPRGNQTIPVRGNPSIWRVTEYLYDKFYSNGPYNKESWQNVMGNPNCQTWREEMYDKAAELMKKIQLNEFTGEDNHGD